MVITGTKRKKVLREMSSFTGLVGYPRIAVLASRYQCTPREVRDLLVQAGFECDEIPNGHVRKGTPPKIIKEKRACPLTEQEVALIKSARLYRELEDGGPVVCLSGSAFRRERAAIMKLLSVFETDPN